jgi:uncharacterized protein YbjT (DUF2867 family)
MTFPENYDYGAQNSKNFDHRYFNTTFCNLRSLLDTAMDSRTAIVFGATGLIGRSLVEELCYSDDYSLIKIFGRNEKRYSSIEKIREFIIDFKKLPEYSDQITGDDLFICLGTTIKKAGSVEKMEEIDKNIPVRIASIASANRVSRLAVVSSLGADAGSKNYYLRIKGEMEKGVLSMAFRTIAVARPSILFGERNERRYGEEVGKFMMKVFGVFLTGKYLKYRGIEGKTVAKAMVKILKDRTGKEIYESDKLQKIADSY